MPVNRASDDFQEAKNGKERIKLLLLLTSTAGGAGTHLYNLASHLSRSEFDVTVAYGSGYPLDQAIEGIGVPVVHLSISRRISPWTNLRGMYQLYRLLKTERFDVMCIGCSVAGFLGRLAGWAAGVPCRVFLIHVFASHPHQSPIKQFVYRMIERFLDLFTTRYVVMCEVSKTFGVKRRIMAAEKVSIIYNGISLNEMALPDAELRAQLGLQPGQRVVGTALRFEPQKGIEYFLRAIALLKEQTPETRFLIAGDGPLRDELIELTASLQIEDVVRFVGWRDDLPRVLQCMDIFCHPTLWEQFPHMVLEAMALALPVVATAVDGVPEMIVDGQTGILVPARDPQALADALRTLLLDPARAAGMGKAGRRRFEAKFTVAPMVAEYEALFRREAARVNSK